MVIPHPVKREQWDGTAASEEGDREKPRGGGEMGGGRDRTEARLWPVLTSRLSGVQREQ